MPVALLHHLLGKLLLRGARDRGQALLAIAPRGGVALLRLTLPRPLAGRTLQHAGHHGGDAARLVAVTHRAAPRRRRRSARSRICRDRRTAHAPTRDAWRRSPAHWH